MSKTAVSMPAQRLRADLGRITLLHGAFLPLWETQWCALTDIVSDSLDSVCQLKTARYANLMRAGSTPPDVTVDELVLPDDRAVYIVLDGRHRVAAARLAGWQGLSAIVVRTCELTAELAAQIDGDVTILMQELQNEFLQE